jgi:hypothetical protein
MNAFQTGVMTPNMIITRLLFYKCLLSDFTVGELQAKLPANGSERVRSSSAGVDANCLAFR